MFRGVNHISMDAKGRMALPAKHREKLLSECGGQLVATIDTQSRCLWIYPLPTWEVVDVVEVAHGQVVGGEAPVVVVANQPDLGEPTLDLLWAAVARRVVDDQHTGRWVDEFSSLLDAVVARGILLIS